MLGSVAFQPASPLLKVPPITRRREEAPPPATPEAAETMGQGDENLAPVTTAEGPSGAGDREPTDKNGQDDEKKPGQPQELSTEQELELRELKARDREVRAHEQAHMGAGGQHVSGGPTYEFTRGPDGQQYAVAGEVNIDVGKESDPRATLQKAQAVRRAALAPADPSGQDRSVAASATSMEREARAELAEEVQQEQGGSSESEGAEQVKLGQQSEEAGSHAAEQTSQAQQKGPARFTAFARMNPYQKSSARHVHNDSPVPPQSSSSGFAPSVQRLDLMA